MPTVDGYPYPNTSAVPDVPADILALDNVLARKNGAGVAYAANAAGLAALVTDGLIKQGMLALQLDTKVLWYREAATWVPAISVFNPHAEFTATSVSTVSGTAGPVGTLTYDATVSSNAVFAIGGASTITITDSGTYVLNAIATIPANPTGLTFIRYVDGVGGQGYLYGSAGIANIAGAVAAGVYMPAGTVVTLSFLHTSASARVLTSRFAITRIA